MNPELVDAVTLDQWAPRLEARGLLPHLVRRLLAATPGVRGLDMPSDEGIVAPGFDGVIDGGPGSAWVPPGPSVWEMGTNEDPRAKAQEDYDKRSKDPKDAVPAETVFVFVTPRRFTNARDWAEGRKTDGIWRDVVVFNADRLHAWLESVPDVHVWLSERLGKQPLGVRTLSAQWERIAAGTEPQLPPTLLLAGRDLEADALRAALIESPTVTAVRGGSRKEAVAFIAAALGLAGIDSDRAPDQPLWVRGAEAFDRLIFSTRPLTLVVGPEEVDAGHAAARGHHVVLTLGAGDYERAGVIALPRPARTAARAALDAVGVPFERADRLAALARRSFAALLRELATARGGKPPEWATGADGPLLAALTLLGGWDALEGDEQVIERIAGLPRAEVERRLAALSRVEDPPWTRSGGAWKLVSPDDSFALVGELLDCELLERWSATAVEVLGEPDPRVGMEMSERLLADLRGEARRRYSGALRRGMAEAAALLGARSLDPLPSGAVGADYAARVVREFLRSANEDATGARWAQLTDLLALLGEAAPEELLDAVEDGLAAEPSPIMALFQDGPGFSAMFNHSPHTGLVWALEGLAWAPEYLSRAALLLGELAEREPGGQLTNRPSNSLREIFLPWHPGTGADLEARLAALDDLRARWPLAAWSLELALLPRLHDTGGPTHRPRFRDWAVEPAVTREALIDAYRQLARRVGEDVGQDPGRWAALAGRLYGLAPAERDALLALLEGLDPQAMSDQERLTLWRALVDEAERHLSVPDADWSLPQPEARKLQHAAERFANEDRPERHARLFAHRVRIPGVPRDDYPAQREAVEAARLHAAAEVLDRHGAEGLLRLAEATDVPRAVGLAAAADDVELSDALMPLLGTQGPRAALAGGWVAGRLARHGTAWARQVLEGDLGDEARVALLLELEPGDETWELVERQGCEVEARYWGVARPFGLSSELLEPATERLLRFDRPWAAVDLLAGAVFDGGQADIELIERVLMQAAQSEDVDAAVHAAWEVGQLLDALERAGLEPERLAGLEFTYFALVEDQRAPRALPTVLAQNPSLFVWLARHVYPREDGAAEDDVRRELASHASQVLYGLRRLPGQDDKGRMDAVALREWVYEVRRQLAQAGRAEAADGLLGQLLSASLPGADGVWPAEAVREVAEALRSGPFEEGLQVGRLNARGPTMRDPYEGGAQERALADGLRSDARRLQATWPRTARVLRAIAEDLDAQARHHDRNAERRADDS